MVKLVVIMKTYVIQLAFWQFDYQGQFRNFNGFMGCLGYRFLLLFYRRLETFRRLQKIIKCSIKFRFSVEFNKQGHFWYFAGFLGYLGNRLLLFKTGAATFQENAKEIQTAKMVF